MIKLINNELNKVKKSRLLFSQILFVVALYIMKRMSSNSIIDLSYNLIPFVGIMICILFGGIVSNEVENGSFRYYLTKPYKRWKVYLSKLLCILIYVFITLIIIITSTVLLSNYYDNDYVIKFFKYSIPVIFMSSLIMYLSTRFKSQSLCVGLSIFILAFSLIISQILFGIKINIIEYTFLPYLDFSIFNDRVSLSNMNNELGIHLCLRNGIIIDTIYFIVFFFIGCYKFNKKDIKN